MRTLLEFQFFWHGAKNPIVPYTFAYNIYEDMKSIDENDKDTFVFILDEKAGHNLSQPRVLQTVSWFETYLQRAGQKI